jgi:hypothetical protein
MTKSLLAAASLVLLTPNACQKDEPARWRYTCGDPVCVGYTVKPAVALCTSQVLGGRCSPEGTTCDPRDDCNRLFVCSVEEPGLIPCPDVP